MAKHLVKCPICNETFDANVEPFVKLNRRYAHESCYKAQEANKSEEEKEKDKLYTYIKKIYGPSANYQKINRQVADYLKQGYSYRGIRKTLIYWFDIKHGDVEKSLGGIGIVPHVYQDALIYWRSIWEAQQHNQIAIAIEPVETQVTEIHIPVPQRKPAKKIRKLFTFLEEGEDEEL